MADMDLILSIIISLILCLILFQYYKNKKVVKPPIFYIVFLIVSFSCTYLATNMFLNNELKNIIPTRSEIQKPMNTGEPNF
jgi:hypothetical protein